MLLYDVAAVAVLAFAGIGFGLQGVGLWPAVVLHAVMSVWCVMYLPRRPVNVTMDGDLPNNQTRQKGHNGRGGRLPGGSGLPYPSARSTVTERLAIMG